MENSTPTGQPLRPSQKLQTTSSTEKDEKCVSGRGASRKQAAREERAVSESFFHLKKLQRVSGPKDAGGYGAAPRPEPGCAGLRSRP